jgi:hypothetical protein
VTILIQTRSNIHTITAVIKRVWYLDFHLMTYSPRARLDRAATEQLVSRLRTGLLLRPGDTRGDGALRRGRWRLFRAALYFPPAMLHTSQNEGA